MKTTNDLIALITQAILLESNNNFIIKYNTSFSLNECLLSFDISYAEAINHRKKLSFLISIIDLNPVKIQSCYWELALHLDRFELTH